MDAFKSAANGGHFEAMKLLFDQGAKIDDETVCNPTPSRKAMISERSRSRVSITPSLVIFIILAGIEYVSN